MPDACLNGIILFLDVLVLWDAHVTHDVVVANKLIDWLVNCKMKYHKGNYKNGNWSKYDRIPNITNTQMTMIMK